MQVAQYTFQSPSTSQVQVGKLDPSSVKEESKAAPLEKAESFTPPQTQEKQPTLTQNSIDLYV